MASVARPLLRHSNIWCEIVGVQPMTNRPSNGNSTTAETLFASANLFEEKRQFKKAFKCLLAAAALGHSSSQLNLGNFYSAGTGTKKSLKKAEYWYRAAFRRGDITAARNLGIDMLARGDRETAIRWFKKGVDHKDGGSFVQLARMLSHRRRGTKQALALLMRLRKLGRDYASELDQEQAEELRRDIRGRTVKTTMAGRKALKG